MFKPGDIVVCINNNIGISTYLELNKIYVVHNAFDGFVSLESVDNTIIFNDVIYNRRIKLEKICAKLSI